MLTIRQIHQKNYFTGEKVFYEYTSEKYYDTHIERKDNDWNFSLTEERFTVPFEKKFIWRSLMKKKLLL
ncbi:hypothetical protein [Priestia megaterium]|uniref:hypothetical protein n=1 Tax=Priestia megaterium TaxID=1404 RepID=UPI00203CC2F9|nr:hypothetical protein [Priestia megaterium]MCM3196926.1 hypothetical protein [Priestia megaterium]